MSVETIAKLLNFEANEKGKYPFRIVDTKTDLGVHMIHYDVDTIGETEVNDSIRNLRGSIVLEEKGIIVPSFGYTPTIITDSFDEHGDFEDKDGNKHSLDEFWKSGDRKDILPMFDGTLLRVWKYNGTIYISTHKKIDATNSRWGASEKFVDMFKRYIEGVFDLEDLFKDISDSSDIPVHNFLLVNIDLMIASKLHFENKKKDGFVVYINSKNCELPIELPKVSFSEIRKTDHSVFKVSGLKTNEEIKDYLHFGFHSELKDVHTHISLGEGLILYNGKSMLKVVSSGYNRRAKIVDNDPNILHRVYEILTESQFPRDNKVADTYLERFPALPCPTEEQIKSFTGNLLHGFPEDWKIPSDEELTGTISRESREMRFRNAVVHYTISLPLAHQKNALTSIDELLNDRFKAIQIVCGNYEKYAKGQFGDDIYPRDQKVYERIQEIVNESKKYAKLRVSRGEKLEGKSEIQCLKKFAVDNIRNLMLKEYGASIYKMVRVLVTDPKKEKTVIA
jgi:hypothetical protein